MILTIHASGVETILELFASDGTTSNSDKWDSGRALSDELIQHILMLFQNSNTTLNDLKGIIIFSGPGSFTSLRIGHSVANALADGLTIPVVGTAGENWIIDGITELNTSNTKESALPFYGAEANITKPK